MTQEIIEGQFTEVETGGALVPATPTSLPAAALDAGHRANREAAGRVFADYRARKAANTRKQHDRALGHFARFLAVYLRLHEGIRLPYRETGELPFMLSYPQNWQLVTWGIVEGFREWLLKRRYSITSVNTFLSVIRRYAKLAAKAGHLDAREAALITTVEGYSHKEGANVNETRETTRKADAKKAEARLMTRSEARALKDQPTDTATGRRDALLVALAVDHGMRSSELADLKVSNFDLDAGTVTFWRRKNAGTDTEWGKHDISRDTMIALRAYMDAGDIPAAGYLLRNSRKGGELTDAGMNRRTVSRRISYLAEQAGIEGLSAHDCRHYCATQYAQKAGVTTRDLMDFFGWNSPAMAVRYQHAAEVSDLAIR